MKYKILYIILFLITWSCSPKKQDSGRLKIVTTTGMIGDAVKNIVGDSADVKVLMGPGVDPHLYKPTPRDVDELAYADIVVCNGLHLEGKMADILKKVGMKKKVIMVASGIDSTRLLVTHRDTENGHVVYDPHIWFDVNIWNQGIQKVGNELAKFDTTNSDFYLQNLRTYSQQLEELNYWTKEKISTIPISQRVMVTAHDAFNYFGKAYDIEVMGLQGISTVAEPGIKDISELVELLVKKKIKAVFVESSVSEKAIEAVIYGCQKKGHQVIIGGTLFSDAMGAAGTPEGTYIGMVKHNVGVIVKGLK